MSNSQSPFSSLHLLHSKTPAMPSLLNPAAIPWFPLHPPPPPPLGIYHFHQPIQISTDFYYPQPLNSHWKFVSHHKNPKVENFGFDPKDAKVQDFCSDQKDPQVQKLGFEVTAAPTSRYHKRKELFYPTPPRFRKIIYPPSLAKTWKVRRAKPCGNDDELKDGNLEKVVEGNNGSSRIAEGVTNLGDEGKTSVMIRNIPNKFRREELLGFLDFYCINHQLEYDFFYLPMDFRFHNNLGYAFVNFTTSSAASKMMALLDGYKWSDAQSRLQLRTSKKICHLNWARIQGKEELVKHFEQSKFCCEDNEYLPVVFSPPRNGSTRVPTPSTVGKLVYIPVQHRRR